MSTLSTFATRFKNLRESSELKQSEIADKLGVSRGAISFYENCDRTPDIEFAVKAARLFGVSTDYLLGLSDYKNSGMANLSVEEIGLSEEATTSLTELSQSSRAADEKKITTLNLLLEDDSVDEWGSHLLHCLAKYLFAEPVPRQPIQFTSEGANVLEGAPDFLESKQDIPNFEYVDVLYDKLLIDRVTRATEGARYRLRNPQIMTGMCEPLVLDEDKRRLLKEAKKNGKPQDND